jgi:hypothetical protein
MPVCPFLQTGTGYVTGNFLADYEEGTAAWRKANIMPVPQPVFLCNFGEFLRAFSRLRISTSP